MVKRNEPSVRRTFERFIVNRHEYEVLIDVTLRGSISYTRANDIRYPNRIPFSLMSLDVEINPQFYWGKIKSFSICK